MLLRHLVGYLPATVLPALTALATVAVFSRLVDPAEYGAYALAAGVAAAGQTVFFNWLQVGATRFHARCAGDGRLDDMRRAIHGGYLVAALAFSAVYTAAMLALPLPDHLRGALWLALPLALLRSMVAVNLAFHRGALRVGRYAAIEAAQAVVGFGLALLFVRTLGLGGAGMLLGPLTAAAACALADLPAMARALGKARPDRQLVGEILVFSLPLAVSFTLQFVLSTSDRLLIEYFLGSAAVGTYAVAYGIAERAVASVFLVVTAAAFPLAVRALEQDGPDAARRQMRVNATALLALTVPACAGLAVSSGHVAAVLIGEEFRAQAVGIIPWIAAATFLAGLQAHFFDQAFHLGRRTTLFLASAGPAAVLNVALNAVLLPRFGIMGAVYASVAAYAAALAGSIHFGRRAFRLDFPVAALARVLCATGLMTAVLAVAPFPTTGAGLAAMVVSGVAVYALAAVALDVAGARLTIRRLVGAKA